MPIDPELTRWISRYCGGRFRARPVRKSRLPKSPTRSAWDCIQARVKWKVFERSGSVSGAR